MPLIAFCQRLAASPAFGRATLAVIALAAVLVGLETSPALAARYGALFHAVDGFILGYFVLEAAVKITAGGRRWHHYFRDPWNVFDFAIVAVCLLPLDSQFAAVLRLARVLRVLRLIQGVPRLRVLVGALLGSIPSMGYVGLLLSIQFYIYAIVGVHFFAAGDPARFGNLGAAMLTLFQTLTLEGWIETYETQVRAGASAFGAIVYFASFILLGAMVTLNLLIGVVVNGLDEMHRQVAGEQADAAGTNTDLLGELSRMELDLERQTKENIARLDTIRRRALEAAQRDGVIGGNGRTPPVAASAGANVRPVATIAGRDG